MIASLCVTTQQLIQALNFQHQHIKFEIELPTENNHTYTLSLLDFSVNINTNNSNETTFKFYRKTARKNIFVNYNSNLPTTSKINFIKNERLRILERCSRKKDNQQCQIDFDKTLRLNDYPCNILREQKYTYKIKRKGNKIIRIKEYFYVCPLSMTTQTKQSKESSNKKTWTQA